MKRLLLPLLLSLAVFSGCGDDEKEDTPTPTPVVEEKPKVADVETISAKAEADGSVTLSGKINKFKPTDLDYGFIAAEDSLFKVIPIKLVLKHAKPELGPYTMTIPADSRLFVKGKKYYFKAAVEIEKNLYQGYNMMSFIF
ncbi:hypothetical protein [Rufibacter hautae]|uniref:Lipoprotein n=1 Tax=Rufibacter hautae TaxID=2595005 RepID=A0A5B6TA71_9BACT|nr:hypothetical protein [Rufibacter hautae]KAA3436460.1 hypothetical protein FOA19_18900 [Rufibacter hautae]